MYNSASLDITFLLMMIIPAAISVAIGIIIIIVAAARKKSYIAGPVFIAAGIVFAAVTLVTMLSLR